MHETNPPAPRPHKSATPQELKSTITPTRNPLQNEVNNCLAGRGPRRLPPLMTKHLLLLHYRNWLGLVVTLLLVQIGCTIYQIGKTDGMIQVLETRHK